MVLNESLSKKIIPIAGGKGGVGKSVLSVNLAMSLAISNKRTILIDLDLGGANLHTLLGIKNTNPGIASFLNDKKIAFNDLVIETPFKNLKFIPGDTLSYGMADITASQKKSIISKINELDADYILMDLGAGSSFNTIDFFLSSNSGLIVTTPHAGSIMNSYAFLKNLTIRFIQKAFINNKEMETFLKRNVKKMLPGTNLTLVKLLEQIGKKYPEIEEKAHAFLAILQPKIILNMMEEEEDFQMIENLSKLVKKDLNIDMDYMGAVLYDRNINESLHNRHPFLLDFQDSLSAQQIFRIGQKIAQSANYPELPIDFNEYKNSFDLGQVEINNDFSVYNEIKKQEEKSKLPEGYDIDQLLELIEKQQKKIHELQNALSVGPMNPMGGGNGGGLFNF